VFGVFLCFFVFCFFFFFSIAGWFCIFLRKTAASSAADRVRSENEKKKQKVGRREFTWGALQRRASCLPPVFSQGPGRIRSFIVYVGLFFFFMCKFWMFVGSFICKRTFMALVSALPHISFSMRDTRRGLLFGPRLAGASFAGPSKYRPTAFDLMRFEGLLSNSTISEFRRPSVNHEQVGLFVRVFFACGLRWFVDGCASPLHVSCGWPCGRTGSRVP